MKLKYIYTRLNVRDYAACKLFYQDVLGFKVSYANDAEEYAELDAGETKITILNRARLKEYVGPIETVTYDPHEAKVVLTFAVPNLEEAIAQLKAKGMMQGGVLTVCFRDPDGNLIEFEQFLS
jgi:catechol 2,3-dioxygenase-like lactoylglutathione lyase family enzyme